MRVKYLVMSSYSTDTKLLEDSRGSSFSLFVPLSTDASIRGAVAGLAGILTSRSVNGSELKELECSSVGLRRVEDLDAVSSCQRNLGPGSAHHCTIASEPTCTIFILVCILFKGGLPKVMAFRGRSCKAKFCASHMVHFPPPFAPPSMLLDSVFKMLHVKVLISLLSPVIALHERAFHALCPAHHLKRLVRGSVGVSRTCMYAWSP